MKIEDRAWQKIMCMLERLERKRKGPHKWIRLLVDTVVELGGAPEPKAKPKPSKLVDAMAAEVARDVVIDEKPKGKKSKAD